MNEKNFIFWLERFGGWILIWVFSLVPFVQWLIISKDNLVFADSYVLFSSLGKVTGLIGLVLYAINLLLAARTRWLENFFGGLNRVYIAHHITGGIALILLLVHPIALALRAVSVSDLTTLREAALFLLPRTIAQDASLADFQQAMSINAGIVAFLGMVVLLVLTFFVKLPYRLWLFTHKFLGVAFMLAGLHVVYISSDVSSNAGLKYYLIGWIVIGLAAFTYRTLMSNVFVRRSTYRVEEVRVVGGNVVSLTFDALHRPINYKPGQFVFIKFLNAGNDGITSEAHPFSIASSPKEHRLRLLVKSLGDYTSALKNIKPGTVAEIEGAYGKFTFTRFGAAPQIWIAGGIGVTPFLSMARSYDQNSPNVDMIYSVVSRSELLDQRAIAEMLPSVHPTFRYFPYVADEQEGFLTAQKIDELCGGVKGKEIFICGPPAMMKSLRQQLGQMGVPGRKIHSEEFSMT